MIAGGKQSWIPDASSAFPQAIDAAQTGASAVHIRSVERKQEQAL